VLRCQLCPPCAAASTIAPFATSWRIAAMCG
jgi:hypothetical protein